MKTSFKIPDDCVFLCRTLRENNYEAYLVGGCARDMLMGVVPSDYDIATNCKPKKVMGMFIKKGYRVIPTGIKHGTVTVIIKHKPYEVTTYRRDSDYYDGRRPGKVFFLNNLKEDIKRRDFTCNALAYDPLENELLDYSGGIADIKKRVLKAVGVPEERFEEDYLRMLRAVRYSSRLSYKIEPKTLEAIKRYESNIKKTASERVLSEVIKMAGQTGKKFAHALEILKKTGLLKSILPEIDIMSSYKHDEEVHPEGDTWEHTLAAIRKNRKRDEKINLAILFHDVGKPLTYSRIDGKIRYLKHHESAFGIIERIAGRLKMKNELKETLVYCAREHMQFQHLLEMTDYKVLQLMMNKNWDILYAVSRADDSARLHKYDKNKWKQIDNRIKALKQKYIGKQKMDKIRAVVNGNLIMNLKGIEPGPFLGDCIARTLEWIVNNSVNITDIDRIKDYVKKL